MLADLHRRHAGPDLAHDAGALVAEDRGELSLRIGPRQRVGVGVADAGRHDLDEDLARLRSLELDRLDRERASRLPRRRRRASSSAPSCLSSEAAKAAVNTNRKPPHARPLPVASGSMVVNRKRSRQRLEPARRRPASRRCDARISDDLRFARTSGGHLRCVSRPEECSGSYGFGRPWPTPKPKASRAESQSLDDGPSEAWSRLWRSGYQPQEVRQLRPAAG